MNLHAQKGLHSIFHFQSKEADSAGEEWMTTFADLLFLLITFFVLQYSTQPLNIGSESNNLSAGEYYDLKLVEDETRKIASELFDQRFTLLNGVGGVQKDSSAENVVLRRVDQALEIALNYPVLESDPSDLTFRSKSFIRRLATVAEERKLDLHVESIKEQEECATLSGELTEFKQQEADGSVSFPTELSSADLGIAAIRQIVDTGFPTSRISATGDSCRSGFKAQSYRLQFRLSRGR